MHALMLNRWHFAVKLNFRYLANLLTFPIFDMETAVHQTLINDLETLLASEAGIDETKAKILKKTAEALLIEQPAHVLKNSLAEALENLRVCIRAQVQSRNESFEIVMSELALAIGAIKNENLKEAEAATQKALSLAGQIHGLSEQRRTQMDTLLEQIYPKMRKLSTWRHWGTTHARENLIAQIKLLVDSRLEPNKITKTLRDAKKQWREWEQSGDHSEHKLWKEFSQACDAAYAPCRTYFEQQKAERTENLAQKRQLVSDMNTRYQEINWSQPEWKEIDRWLRQTRGQYFKIGHIDYKHHKKLKAQLEKICALFEDHLSRERDRNLKARQSLLAETSALEQFDDEHEAIRQLGQIKKKWLVTVLSKRNIENKLWEQFQKAQDRIYAKRNAANKAANEQRKENLKQKRLVVESLNQAAGAAEDKLLSGQSVLVQHEQQFNSIADVPRGAENGLRNSWRNAQKRFQAALIRAQRNYASLAQKSLIDKAKFCAQLEQQQQLGETVDPDSAHKAYEALPTLSKELEAQMQARLNQALNGDNASLQQNTDAQLNRCMKLEVMLDLPTPVAYQKAKMAFQIERLSASMKKQNQAVEDVSTLKQQLLTTGAIHRDKFEHIWSRIDSILIL